MEAGIFSEKAPTTDLLHRQSCCLLSISAEDFGEARRQISDLVATSAHYGWVGKLPSWSKLS